MQRDEALDLGDDLLGCCSEMRGLSVDALAVTRTGQSGVPRAMRVQALLDRAASAKMADFCGLHESELLYHVTRGGLRVFAATAAMLGPRRVRHLIEYRVAQYVHIGFVDVDRLDATLESNAARGGRLLDTTPEDIHIFAMSEQGELLCCAVLAAVPDASDTTRM